MPKAAIDLINETNEGVDVTISYAESLEKTYSGNADIFIDQRKSSVVNLGFPYRSLKDDKFALCGALPFLLETKSTLLIENLTIVFDIEFPSQDIFDLAKTAGYGNFVNTANNSCAYREKTHFKDDFGRTSLSRKFIHSNGRTRIAYQFENLLPGEPVPISIAIPLLPNTFLGFGDPIRQPFDEEPGNADFSNEALSNSEISLISHPISISISYIVNGPRQRAGNMLIYVHPGSVNADILFPSFLIANNDSFDKRRSLREIWSGEATNIIFQNLKTSLVTRKVIEDILDPEDTDLLSRQYFGKNINLELLPIGERILYVSDRSKVLASVGSLFSNSSDAMVFDMTNFNERRNMMRTELILSHQFPYLFQKYLEQKN